MLVRICKYVPQFDVFVVSYISFVLSFYAVLLSSWNVFRGRCDGGIHYGAQSTLKVPRLSTSGKLSYLHGGVERNTRNPNVSAIRR